MKPGKTRCLLIGAARPYLITGDDGTTVHSGETAERMFQATQMDLAKMVNYCAKFVDDDGGEVRQFTLEIPCQIVRQPPRMNVGHLEMLVGRCLHFN